MNYGKHTNKQFHDILKTKSSSSLKKYPWEKLTERMAYFIWDNVEDANRIRSASTSQKFKISVRKKEGKLIVTRIN